MAKKARGDNDNALETFMALVQKTSHEAPTPEELAALREGLRQREAVWRRASDLRQKSHQLMLKPLLPAMREAVYLRLEAMQRDLGYAEAPAIEKLLIEQIGTCWLNLELTQLRYAVTQRMALTPTEADGWERRLNAAERRYLKALEALAQMRRRRPLNVFQLNVGAQQVNVAGGMKVKRKKGA